MGTDQGQEHPDTHGHPPDRPSGETSGEGSGGPSGEGSGETSGEGSGGPGVAECGFVVVQDPGRVMAAWLVACRDADRVRAAVQGAGLGGVFGTIRGDLDSAGDPVVVLGGLATAPDVARLLELLAPVRRVDGAA